MQCPKLEVQVAEICIQAGLDPVWSNKAVEARSELGESNAPDCLPLDRMAATSST